MNLAPRQVVSREPFATSQLQPAQFRLNDHRRPRPWSVNVAPVEWVNATFRANAVAIAAMPQVFPVQAQLAGW